MVRSWHCRPRLTSPSRGMHVGSTSLGIENLSHLLLFYKDNLDRMHADQFVWDPCSDRILCDYSLALQENELSHH